MMETDERTGFGTGGWAGDLNPLDDAEERAVIFAVLDSFR